MASISNSAVAFTGTTASDLLRSSKSGGANGIPLRTLGKARFSVKTRDLSVVAKVRKVKKHEYPWPEDPDPNVKGGVLTHLSHFKPLKEKPKPVTLDFEKPLVALEKKIIDVRKMANETGLDFSDQILSLENKYQQALKDLYTHLTPIQRVNIARHPNRPTFLDHIFSITEKFVELHGDRAGYDDPAIVTGIGTIDGKRYIYRKALRMMYYADHHGFPIVTLIDTPGAFADLKSEELGQGEAIAHNLRTMFGLKVPIVSIVIGEGGSGGALAIGCANKLLMLENAVFYVASPEACAAILWKTAKAAPKAAEKLKITGPELCKLQVADGIIPEPLGGAHADPSWTSQQIKNAINEAMDELNKMDTEALLKHRMLKFRKIGGFQEGVPVDPIRKVNMKKKDEPVAGKTPVIELEYEVEKLKQQISKAKESSSKPTELALNEMIEKLKKEIDLEYSAAVEAMGLKGRCLNLREECLKANSQDQLMHPVLMDRIEKLSDEFNKGLPTAPNYTSLKYKLDMLKEFSIAKSNLEKKGKGEELKLDINKKLKEVMDQPKMKEKMHALKAEVQKSGASSAADLDNGTKERISKMKKEIELELASVLKSMDLNVEIVRAKELIDQDLKAKVESLEEETNKKIENLVKSSDLKNTIKLLKLEVAKAGKAPDAASKNKIEALEQQIKRKLSAAISSSEMKEKHEELRAEIKALECDGGLNGSLKNDDPKEASSKYDESRAEGVSFLIQDVFVLSLMKNTSGLSRSGLSSICIIQYAAGEDGLERRDCSLSSKQSELHRALLIRRYSTSSIIVVRHRVLFRGKG
ncbi:hypothetical protein NC651_015679 [Populus alba x Populus x berolinensis]|nr:hypothetical protein NC651_015679 [Populus alba x Populus x berolinensis]